MAKIEVLKEYCKSCKLCVLACPKEVLEIGKNTNSMGYDIVIMKKDKECVACKRCAVVWPEAAIEVYK